MPKAKRKSLPKDFSELLRTADLATLQAVFDTHELDARGGVGKQTALAYHFCSEDLTHWLIDQGADLEAKDTYGRTPLHNRAASGRGQIGALLARGGDVHARDNEGDTPLHKAARFANAEGVRQLLERGADKTAVNAYGRTPLAVGLESCSNIQIEAIATIAGLLYEPGAPAKGGLVGFIDRALGRTRGPSPDIALMQDLVRRIGETFEFHRAGVNPDFLERASAGLDRLYALFDVPPVPRRQMHDDRTPIVARTARWEDQHQELWELLVPSSGAAPTVQGEVIRITGRVADEVERNGAVNWDANYGKMVRALLVHFGSGEPLPAADRERAAALAADVRVVEGAPRGLCELAVCWVRLNPKPVPLSPPAYTR